MKILSSLLPAGIETVGKFENVAIYWDFLGVIIVSVVLLAVAPTHQSADFVFTKFNTDLAPGIHSKPYIFSLGLLSALFTLIGEQWRAPPPLFIRLSATTIAILPSYFFRI